MDHAMPRGGRVRYFGSAIAESHGTAGRPLPLASLMLPASCFVWIAVVASADSPPLRNKYEKACD